MKRFSKALIAGMVCLFSVALVLLALATWIISAPPTVWSPDFRKSALTLSVPEEVGVDYDGTPASYSDLWEKVKEQITVTNEMGKSFSVENFTPAGTFLDGDADAPNHGDVHALDKAPGDTYRLTFSLNLNGDPYKNYYLSNESSNGYSDKVSKDFSLTVKYKTARVIEGSSAGYGQRNTEEGGSMGAFLSAIYSDRDPIPADAPWYTLEDALQVAKENAEKDNAATTVVVAGQPDVFESGVRTKTDPMQTTFTSLEGYACGEIPAGVTLLVPYNGNDGKTRTDEEAATAAKWEDRGNLYGYALDYINNVYPQTAGFHAKLILPRPLKVSGTLFVNGLRHLVDGANGTGYTATKDFFSSGTGGQQGFSYSALEIKEGATLTVASRGELRAYGFVHGGGAIVAEDSAVVTEPLSMNDWRGGTNTTGMLRNTNVFPVNQYSLPNISCDLTLEAGATYYAQAAVTFVENVACIDESATFVSGALKDGFLQIASGTVKKTMNAQTGKITFTIRGDITCNNIAITLQNVPESVKELVKYFLGSDCISTEERDIPIPGNIIIQLESDNSINAVFKIPKGISVKLLPGAAFEVGNRASLTVEGKLYSYGGYSGDNVTEMTTGTISDKTFKAGSPQVLLTQWQDGPHPYPASDVDEGFFTPVKHDYSVSQPATFTIGNRGTVTVASEATFATRTGGENDAKLTLDANAHVQNVTLIECLKGATDFFQTTLSGTGANGEGPFEAGNTYTFRAGKWEISQVAAHFVFNTGGGRIESGENLVTKMVTPGSSVTLEPSDFPTVTYPGYTLVGWYYNREKIEDGLTVSVSKSTTFELTAQWKAIEYTLEFVIDGEKQAETRSFTIEGAAYPLDYTPAAPDGYTLDGWYLSDDFSGKPSAQLSGETLFENLNSGDTVTLYGRYMKAKTITFVYDDGETTWPDWPSEGKTGAGDGVIKANGTRKTYEFRFTGERIDLTEYSAFVNSDPTNPYQVKNWSSNGTDYTMNGKAMNVDVTGDMTFTAPTDLAAEANRKYRVVIFLDVGTDETYSLQYTMLVNNEIVAQNLHPGNGSGTLTTRLVLYFPLGEGVSTIVSSFNLKIWIIKDWKDSTLAFVPIDEIENHGIQIVVSTALVAKFPLAIQYLDQNDTGTGPKIAQRATTSSSMIIRFYIKDEMFIMKSTPSHADSAHSDGDGNNVCDICGEPLSASPALASLASALPALPASLSSSSSASLSLRRKFL